MNNLTKREKDDILKWNIKNRGYVMYDVIKVTDNVYDELYSGQCLIDFTIPKTSHAVPVLIYFHGGDLESGSRKEDFISAFAAEYGVAVASVDYRMYPTAKFPDYVNDGARACEFVWNYGQSTGLFNKFFIGGSSAGAYIAMMLYFCPSYLREFILFPHMFSGYIFDAGQTTTHSNVLKEHCTDPRVIRVDHAAPLYHAENAPMDEGKCPSVLFVTAENELPGINAQNRLLMETMLEFGYDPKKIEYIEMKGFSHGAYLKQSSSDGKYPINSVFGEFITKNLA